MFRAPTQICSHNLRCTAISSLTCGYRTCARHDGAPGFYRIEVPAWPGRVMICSPGTMSEQQAVAWVPGGVVVERYRSSLLFPDDRARHPALPALRRRPAVSAVRRPALDSPAAYPALSRWIASASTCSAAAAVLGTGSRCWACPRWPRCRRPCPPDRWRRSRPCCGRATRRAPRRAPARSRSCAGPAWPATTTRR